MMGILCNQSTAEDSKCNSNPTHSCSDRLNPADGRFSSWTRRCGDADIPGLVLDQRKGRSINSGACSNDNMRASSYIAPLNTSKQSQSHDPKEVVESRSKS